MDKDKHLPTGDYEVGYARPPKQTQFKPGRSGNPRGRRKESEQYRDIVLRIMNQKHIGIENGKRRRMSKFKLGFNNLANKAAMGDRLAWREVLRTMECFGIKLSADDHGRFTFIIEDWKKPDEDIPTEDEPTPEEETDD